MRGFRAFVVVACVTVLSCSSEQPHRALPSAPAASFEQQTLTLINARRASGARCGRRHYKRVPPLRAASQLMDLAERYAAKLLASRRFSHIEASGRSPEQRAGDSGVASFLGEALAKNARSPARAVESLMASDTHCKTLMHASAREVGIAFREQRVAAYVSYLVIELTGR